MARRTLAGSRARRLRSCSHRRTPLELRERSRTRRPDEREGNANACGKNLQVRPRHAGEIPEWQRSRERRRPCRCAAPRTRTDRKSPGAPAQPAESRARPARWLLEAQHRIRVKENLRQSPENRKTNSPEALKRATILHAAVL